MAHYPYSRIGVPKLLGVFNENTQNFAGQFDPPDLERAKDKHVLMDLDETTGFLNLVFNPFQIGFSADLHNAPFFLDSIKLPNFRKNISLDYFRHLSKPV